MPQRFLSRWWHLEVPSRLCAKTDVGRPVCSECMVSWEQLILSLPYGPPDLFNSRISDWRNISWTGPSGRGPGVDRHRIGPGRALGVPGKRMFDLWSSGRPLSTILHVLVPSNQPQRSSGAGGAAAYQCHCTAAPLRLVIRGQGTQYGRQRPPRGRQSLPRDAQCPPRPATMAVHRRSTTRGSGPRNVSPVRDRLDILI